MLETSVESWQGVDEVFLEFHDFAPCSRSAIVDHLGRAGLVLVDEAFGVLHLARTSKSRWSVERAIETHQAQKRDPACLFDVLQRR